MEKIYDTIIVGGGPAGLAAALYAARSRMSVLLFEKEKMGGQIVTTADIANYPGSVHKDGEENCSGPELIARMVQQAQSFGAERIMEEIKTLKLTEKIKVVETVSGKEYKAKTVILANGAVPKKLGCKGEKEFAGKGVSYCATCDADFFKDFEVFVIGGGDAAVEEAIYLTEFAREVNLIVRKPVLRCAKSIEERAKANPKLKMTFNTELIEIRGEGIVESALFKNNVTDEEFEHFANEDDGTFGIFIFIGFNPNTDILKGIVELDKYGFVSTTEDMETNIQGVYAAGDLRKKSLRQVVTATADGAIAATVAYKYIQENF